MSPPQPGLNGKECRLPRGRFLGGSSGSNGTICIRGVKQDYDDWGFPEWSGDEMFRAMKKVCQRLPSTDKKLLLIIQCRQKISTLKIGSLTTLMPTEQVVHSTLSPHQSTRSPTASSKLSNPRDFLTVLICSALVKQPTGAATR